jgi:ABC-2 type transport system ATP-binding protein/lipopolysaccharide transport system ATP-binding protein
MYLYGLNTQIAEHDIPVLEPGHGVFRFALDPLLLREGNYFLSLSVHSWDHATQFHRREDWYPFGVKNDNDAPGMVTLPTRWG